MFVQTNNAMLEFVAVINTDNFLHECHRTHMYLSSVSVDNDYSCILAFIRTAISLHWSDS